jgi:ABC-type multidrug transport system fused ATPase/permease subunit
LNRIFKDIFNILNAREKRKLWILSISDVIISVLDIGFLILLLFVINFYTSPVQRPSLGFISMTVFYEHPLLLIVVFFILFTLKNAIGFIVSGSQYRFVYGVASRLSRDGLLHYLNGNYPDYVHIDSSVINRKISQQPIEFSHYVLNGIQQVFSQTILILVTCLAIILYNPMLFPLLIIFLTPPVFFISFIVKRKLNTTQQNGKIAGERAIQHLQEALAGYVESNIYVKNEFFADRYYRFQSQLNRYLSEKLTLQSVPGRLIEVFALFGLLVLVVANSFGDGHHGIPLVTIGALMIAVYKIIPGIVRITNTITQIKSYAYSTIGLAIEAPQHPEKNNQQVVIESVKFNEVNFSYQGKNILKNFSLEICKGDFLGITGISGRGKTTMINLLLGFLTPDSGRICINSRPADSACRKSYWNRIAYCKQQHFFLHASIKDNITLEEGGHDQERLNKILGLTGIDQMIGNLPGGLETKIVENGKNFSGGQRQRFIFARALYKDADLFIFDEPFNELDESAQRDMLKQLQRLTEEGRMVLMITHNKEALHYCNRTMVLDE